VLSRKWGQKVGNNLHFKMAIGVQRQNCRTVLGPLWLIYTESWFSLSQVLNKAKCLHSSLPYHRHRLKPVWVMLRVYTGNMVMFLSPGSVSLILYDYQSPVTYIRSSLTNMSSRLLITVTCGVDIYWVVIYWMIVEYHWLWVTCWSELYNVLFMF